MRYIRATLNTYLPCVPSGDFLRGSGFSGVQLRWAHRLESLFSGQTELSVPPFWSMQPAGLLLQGIGI
jgi:hypothetical protein